jgi:phenylalanyl-tRNA synthetase alpha chain
MSTSLIKTLDEIESFASKAALAATELSDLQQARVQFLGKKSPLTEALKALGGLSPDERKAVGQRANEAKARLEDFFAQRETALKQQTVAKKLDAERIDVTLDGPIVPLGKRHPVMRVLRDVTDVFRSMGFDIQEGPQIESDFYNFEALNIPANHPARDMQDTFYLPNGHLLRTHTSPVQVRVMQNQKPPIAMVAPGAVYRNDSDVTHTPMFHQMEALVVDKGIHFGHLKAVIAEFLKRVFASELNVRFRPSFFPFTEPSAEVDMSCVICTGGGCKVCKGTGWLEIMGCGLVDPAVFAHVGIDSSIYTGFAFGVGIERMTMLKYGINDLRLFFENDLRFLEQF